MIGVWNSSVVLTYLGAAAATGGIVAAVGGHAHWAIAALVVAGVCDLFDGLVARRFERDARAEAFGVQIDSLTDAVSFLALPVAVVSLFASGWWLAPVAAVYVVAGLARLAYFNLEVVEGSRTHYRGLPVTYAALVVPVVTILPLGMLRGPIVGLALCSLAVAFLVNRPVPKPRGAAYVVFALLAVGVLVALPWLGLDR